MEILNKIKPENIIYNIGFLLILFFLIKVIVVDPVLNHLYKKTIIDKYTLNISYAYKENGKMGLWHDNPKNLGSGITAKLDLTNSKLTIKSIYFNIVKK